MSQAILIHNRQAANGPLGVLPQAPTDAPGPDALVSILVACPGQLELTRLCVPNLLRHSRAPFELHFLDSGAFDGTTDYLSGVAAAAPARVEVVRVAAPRGGPAPAKENVAVRGHFVALLNNDVLVTADWLTGLVQLACLDPAIGMVAPRSNYAPHPLRVERVPYRIRATSAACGLTEDDLTQQLADLERFAAGWREQNVGQWSEVERLGGGCVLVKRQVLQTLGLFPTRSPLGCFDTEGLSERVRQAGYRLAIGGDVFVHHFGSRCPSRA